MSYPEGAIKETCARSLRKPSTKTLVSVGLVVAMGLLCVFCGRAQQKPIDGQSSAQFGQLIYSVKGPDLYQAYCAACHGTSGRGDGPVAPELKAMVPDLTVLAKNNQGQFPAARVRLVIAGENMTAAHGTRAMPVWGPIFHQIERDQDLGAVRIENLTKYLQSIQRK